jgi:aspartate oxidase
MAVHHVTPHPPHLQALQRVLLEHPRINYMANTAAIDLITDGGHDPRCKGVHCLDRPTGQVRSLRAACTVLATGGLGEVSETTSSHLIHVRVILVIFLRLRSSSTSIRLSAGAGAGAGADACTGLCVFYARACACYSQIYKHTSNPSSARGEGYALAARAGCAMVNMEYIQFHPTTLAAPGAGGFLLTEALRGEVRGGASELEVVLGAR